jgi:hypothetical protein
MQAQDVSKIQGRFKTRLTLASADVREVIQKRLLAKKEEEPEVLTTIYDRERDNLQTLFRFGDNSIQFNGWRGSDEFCDFYPFHPYQFDLFQLAIMQLSKHNAFTGKHTCRSVSARCSRSFQEAVKALRKRRGRSARDVRPALRRDRGGHPGRHADHHQAGRAPAGRWSCRCAS